jgi:hypothetical protein
LIHAFPQINAVINITEKEIGDKLVANASEKWEG